MWAALPNRKQSSWDFCNVPSTSGGIGLVFGKAGSTVIESFGFDMDCFGTEEETG